MALDVTRFFTAANYANHNADDTITDALVADAEDDFNEDAAIDEGNGHAARCRIEINFWIINYYRVTRAGVMALDSAHWNVS